MKTLFRLFSVISLCLLASCDDNEIPVIEVEPEKGVNTCIMSFTGSFDGYDGTTRAAGEYEWADGDKLYITFGGASGASGIAEYASADSLWLVTYSGTLVQGETTECSVRFFENAVHSNDSVMLDAHSVSYASTYAFYNYADDMIRMKGFLAPTTGRIHFVADTLHTFALSGIRYNTMYTLSGDSLQTSDSPLSLTMHAGDSTYVTDYIYALYADTASRKLELSNDSLCYSKIFPAAMLSPAVCGYIRLPLPDACNGWEVYANVGHGYVDLGLPSGLKWATCNVGATAPEEYGNYYAWGEIETKDDYSESTSLTNGMELGNISGNPQYDAATANWGGDWRVPTIAEFDELLNNCTRTWTTQNGVNGYLVTGPNGNSIFLPAAGCRGATSLYDVGSYGYYWSSSPDDTSCAYNLCFNSGDHNTNWSNRHLGFSVRPVYDEASVGNYTVSVSSDLNGVASIEGTTNTSVTASAGTNVTVVAIPNVGYRFSGWYVENNETALSTDATYTFTVSASVALVAKFEREENSYNGHEYVDLGLPSGLLWATGNVGATAPEEYGNYYAWGEVETKDDYSESTSLTYGMELGDISGNPTYDVARAKWGEDWRMPTNAEFDELLNNCTWEWTTQNEVNGYRVTGSNGNSIFLPAAGSRLGTSLYGGGSLGCYWSSTPYDTNNAYGLYFSSDNHHTSWLNRDGGQSVRPVKGEQPVVSAYASVDLGLPSGLKWATCNVGATAPEEYGNHYAWGEINTKNNYSASTSLTYGMELGDISGNPQYDAATANWGGNWRMPTSAEFEELLSNCTWSWTTRNGVNGYLVTGPNGNSIFLPAAGYRHGSSLGYAGSYGNYWSSTPNGTYNAYYLYFSSGIHYTNWYYRDNGRSVRPVKGEQPVVSAYASVDLGLPSGLKWATCNVGATAPEEYGNYYAWGEVNTKDDYSESTSLTYGLSLSDISGNPQYDAAAANWGGNWRMPTSAEFEELLSNCTWSWTTRNGVNGYLVTGSNGNSIFLPAAGYRSGTSLYNVGSDSYYWSSTPNGTGSAYLLYFSSGDHYRGWNWRYYGFSVRPVSE